MLCFCDGLHAVGDIESDVHAAVWQADAVWCGWAGSVGVKATTPAKRRKPVSPFSQGISSVSLVDTLAADAVEAVEEVQRELDVADPVLEAELEVSSDAAARQEPAPLHCNSCQ